MVWCVLINVGQGTRRKSAGRSLGFLTGGLSVTKREIGADEPEEAEGMDAVTSHVQMQCRLNLLVGRMFLR